jgi:hypothetical protein
MELSLLIKDNPKLGTEMQKSEEERSREKKEMAKI